MKYQELRDKIENFSKYSGVQKIPRSLIVNKGFPGNFNISFGEAPFLEKFGNYLDNSEAYNFSTIQQVIRVNDFNDALDDTHLLLFDMADVSGFIGGKDIADEKRKDIADFTIRKIFEFLINELGLENISLIKISRLTHSSRLQKNLESTTSNLYPTKRGHLCWL